MANEISKLYAGPVAESLPTSVSAFSHRRTRADSTTSFTFFHEDLELATEQDDQTVYSGFAGRDELVRHSVSDVGDLDFGQFEEEEDDSADRDYAVSEDDYVLHPRRSSTHSRSSIHARLLRTESVGTATSLRINGRTQQKIYMVNEDLTIVMAGFRTSIIGRLIYLCICLITGGLGYLALRWLPRWYVKVLGQPCSLQDCDWVVIENQWGEMLIMDVKQQPYGRPLSSVFGLEEKPWSLGLDEDNDPLMDYFRYIDYRYVRFCFHPLKDKFVLFNGWKDPDWTDTRRARLGLSSDEKSLREIVFGYNLIDIEQKSIGQLLTDEVSCYLPLPHSQHTLSIQLLI